jgi:hypothetical protein
VAAGGFGMYFHTTRGGKCSLSSIATRWRSALGLCVANYLISPNRRVNSLIRQNNSLLLENNSLFR